MASNVQKRSERLLAKRIEESWYDASTTPELRGICLIINNLDHNIVEDYNDLFKEVIQKKTKSPETYNDPIIKDITSIFNSEPSSEHALFKKFKDLLKVVDEYHEIESSEENNDKNRDDKMDQLISSSKYFLEEMVNYKSEKSLEMLEKSNKSNVTYRDRNITDLKLEFINTFFLTWRRLIVEKIGSLKNVHELQKTFSDFKYDIQIKSNQTRNDMENALKEISSEIGNVQSDSSVVCILSHGSSNLIHGYQKKSHLSLPEIVDCLSSKNNNALIEKPKFIFISACRGEKSDDGFECFSLAGDGRETKVPFTRDFFIAFGCFNGYKSQITPSGTPFIQSLCKILKEGAQTSITTLMPFIVQDVEETIEDEPEVYSLCDVVTYESSLSKQFRFLNITDEVPPIPATN